MRQSAARRGAAGLQRRLIFIDCIEDEMSRPGRILGHVEIPAARLLGERTLRVLLDRREERFKLFRVDIEADDEHDQDSSDCAAETARAPAGGGVSVWPPSLTRLCHV